jgi:GNAT superfamily N-acetyltransferase
VVPARHTTRDRNVRPPRLSAGLRPSSRHRLAVSVRGGPRPSARGPHWYLAFIGVDPVRQGHGVGAALLRSRLRRCDQEGLPAYLESSKPENVPLYQHFGFHVTGTLDLPKGAPVVTTMWRPGDLRDAAG